MDAGAFFKLFFNISIHFRKKILAKFSIRRGLPIAARLSVTVQEHHRMAFRIYRDLIKHIGVIAMSCLSALRLIPWFERVKYALALELPAENAPCSLITKALLQVESNMRYYERIGLIPLVGRNAASVRNYSEHDGSWIDFIKCMRDAGVQMEALIEYVALFQQGDAPPIHASKSSLINAPRSRRA
jgi:hypothetical protein